MTWSEEWAEKVKALGLSNGITYTVLVFGGNVVKSFCHCEVETTTTISSDPLSPLLKGDKDSY